MRLALEDVGAGYDGRPVLRALGFTLDEGAIGCLLGPSGCGKTTALRVIAGFEPVVSGRVLGDSAVLTEPGRAVPPEHRRIGLVFQDLALLPHLSAAENIAFGLHRLSRKDAHKRTHELLELMDLGAFARAYPHALSGGQQQRVALARALAPRPRLLLLDEPFSALDVELRERLSQDVRRILKEQGTTALLVTHTQSEAFAMADVVGVLHEGRLRQWDSAYRLYHRPADRFVADFIGEGAWLRGIADAAGIDTELGRLPSPRGAVSAGRVDVLLRPDDLVHDDDSPVRARVAARAFRGAEFLYTLELGSGARVLSLVPSHHDHPVGSLIGVRMDLEHVVAFAADAAD